LGHGRSCYNRGLYEEAIKYLLKGVDFSERINWLAIGANAHNLLGSIYFIIGEYQKSKFHYKKAVSIIEKNKTLPSWMNLNRIGVARAKVMNNEKDIEIETLYDYVDENNLKLYDGCMRRYIGEILLNIDDQQISEAENWIKKAIEAHRNNGMNWHLAEDYALYADLFKRQGYQAKAKENLSKAMNIFQECGADGWVDKTKKQLEALT
jgi:tetratricopeptide (TPR) repeat protein